MDDTVRRYIDGIAPENRPLFDRIHRLVLAGDSVHWFDWEVALPRIFVGAWRHGISIYGWDQGRDRGFTARHPELKTSKGTLRLRPQSAADISDDELRDLVRAALER